MSIGYFFSSGYGYDSVCPLGTLPTVSLVKVLFGFRVWWDGSVPLLICCLFVSVTCKIEWF
jgi:hypothetical protein